MDSDDLEFATPKPSLQDLDEMSIEAIEEYIETLKQEIKRSECAVAAKKTARAGADAFFKA